MMGTLGCEWPRPGLQDAKGIQINVRDLRPKGPMYRDPSLPLKLSLLKRQPGESPVCFVFLVN